MQKNSHLKHISNYVGECICIFRMHYLRVSKIRRIKHKPKQFILGAIFLVICSQYNLTANADTVVTDDEPKLRAAIVLGIMRFTKWPDELKSIDAFNICMYGNPPSQQKLLGLGSEKRYLGFPIVMRIFSGHSTDTSACNLIILGAAIDAQFSNALLKRKESYGILTICDNCDLAIDAAIINLLRRKTRIVFEVDMNIARKNGILFSSSLLELASDIK